MPETRYSELYNGKGNLILSEPYIVSDEQLAREKDSRDLKTLASKTDLTASEIKQAILLILRFVKNNFIGD